MTDEYPQILKTDHVAAILGWDVRKVRREAREGRLPAHKMPGDTRYRFFRDEMVEWLRSQPGGF